MTLGEWLVDRWVVGTAIIGSSTELQEKVHRTQKLCYQHQKETKSPPHEVGICPRVPHSSVHNGADMKTSFMPTVSQAGKEHALIVTLEDCPA